MPHRTGRGTYKGYESPETSGWPKPIQDTVRRVYGGWRVRHPGENPTIKARGARIAWYVAKRKYPHLYKEHVQEQHRLRTETRKEMKEHPWAGQKTAQRIATDHITKQERHRMADLHATARQQRAWSKTAQNESVSENRKANKIRTKNPVQSKDLKQDAGIAKDFAKWRKEKAKNYDLEAERIANATGG
jgi:hypothetical protein